VAGVHHGYDESFLEQRTISINNQSNIMIKSTNL